MQPSEAQIDEYIANPLVENLKGFSRESYGVKPSYDDGTCSGKPGWNVK